MNEASCPYSVYKHNNVINLLEMQVCKMIPHLSHIMSWVRQMLWVILVRQLSHSSFVLHVTLSGCWSCWQWDIAFFTQVV